MHKIDHRLQDIFAYIRHNLIQSGKLDSASIHLPKTKKLNSPKHTDIKEVQYAFNRNQNYINSAYIYCI